MSVQDQKAKGRKMTYLQRAKFTKGASISKHLALISALLISLVGCSGKSVSNHPEVQRSSSPTAVSVSPEVAAFRDTVYNGKDSSGKSTGILRLYCSNCHKRGGQTPSFADANVNTAYNQLISNGVARTDSNGTPYADLGTPANSRMVTKVAGGHHCWSNSGTDCAGDAAALAQQIQDWVNAKNGVPTDGGTGGGSTKVAASIIQTLQAPTTDVAPSPFKSLPDPNGTPGPDYGAFATLHKLLNDHCVGCHVSTSPTAQTPFFADPVDTNSYQALYDSQKIDVNNPMNSRLYLRLAQDSHNCWSTCSDNATEMYNAIKAFADSIPQPSAIDSNIVPSQALTLPQGQVVSGGIRYEGNIIAKYTFSDQSEAAGSKVLVAKDTSGIDPPADLTIPDDPNKVSWVSGWGLDFKNGGRAIASIASSQKLYDLIVSTGAYSIEAWVVPGNVTQGMDFPASIVTYSSGDKNRNFTLGQQQYNYTIANRVSDANAIGETLSTFPDNESLQATLQHVVVTYDSTNGRKIYVNGKQVAVGADAANFADDTTIGFLDQWDPNFVLTVGADSNSVNNWAGKVRFLAVYNAALTPDQIKMNFDAGVGQKFNLLFKISQLDSALPNDSYIWFTASEYDNASYLFSNPQFVVLNADPNDPLLKNVNTTDGTSQLNTPLSIKGIKIGINGKEVEVGQAFADLDLTTASGSGITDSPQSLVGTKSYDFTGSGTPVTIPAAASGTVIPKKNGASGQSADQFFLSFGEFNGQTGLTSGTATIPAPTYDYTTSNPSGYVVGLRTFDELNATMAQVTGVKPATATVSVKGTATTINDIFDNLKQQLPSQYAMKGFASAVQMGVANLAAVYCDAMVSDSALRTSFFGDSTQFNFNASVDAAFTTTAKQNLVNAFMNKMVGANLGTQPDSTTISNALFGDGSTNSSGGLYGTLYQSCRNNPTATTTAPACSNSSGNTRTLSVVKAMCTAVLSSSAMSMK